ncbi:MAG: hypothetical protein ABR915_05940 [Thermoguttaceae bacterium]
MNVRRHTEHRRYNGCGGKILLSNRRTANMSADCSIASKQPAQTVQSAQNKGDCLRRMAMTALMTQRASGAREFSAKQLVSYGALTSVRSIFPSATKNDSSRRRNRYSPATSLTPHEPNGYLNAAGLDDPFLAFGVPVDALARLGRQT